ncbi:MSMEG_1061 family FMN-dependent PPOX-type flavoprotein [Roseomonas marmotae]|uniref:Pyridoxamine 5'-phosphate oxidase family protein n=1 Tax=Roseomonas marmotae TaxID=2768161 RepID=A0ABS3KHR8_9PROT|nr:MSMEG_1061 family FMN-dependent PPOX-type flavoprotein [Roseomonas marmotae]MBO1077018.1 pyridoxamine 5'-phosphate oxidase family protein [Roseomonas marmotae]QTI78416.1 pyridoxamine 5'-phosphate oxidase family protein [Roseomonas marmotae]
MTDAHAVTTQEQLQALYPPPRELVLKKVADRIDPRTAEFIGASPFAVLATFGARGPHVTPRGDAPGFIDVLDEKTLVLPDRRGNNRLDALRDVVDNPAVTLLFLVPGVGETLRVAGKARLSADPELCARYAVQGQNPVTVMVISVEEVFMQCARAIHRSRLWKGQEKPAAIPSAGELLAAHTKGMVDAEEYDRERGPVVASTLY